MNLPATGAVAVGGPALVGGSTVGANYCVRIKGMVSVDNKETNRFDCWAKYVDHKPVCIKGRYKSSSDSKSTRVQ
jgi:hypothetical protein